MASTKMTKGFYLIQDLFKLRWIPEILASIDSGHHAYSEILKSVEFMSHTELNRKLNILMDKEAIEKVENTVGTGYYLKPFGEDLDHIFKHFEEMSDKYFEEKVI